LFTQFGYNNLLWGRATLHSTIKLCSFLIIMRFTKSYMRNRVILFSTFFSNLFPWARDFNYSDYKMKEISTLASMLEKNPSKTLFFFHFFSSLLPATKTEQHICTRARAWRHHQNKPTCTPKYRTWRHTPWWVICSTGFSASILRQLPIPLN
jgi:hypothetical protein